jgi:glycosyltransferase involved in cell wall biosynthesis
VIEELPAQRRVYYCVDDFSVWPGLDGQAMRSMEARLLERVDSVIVVSETLLAKFHEWKGPIDYLEHGVDLEFWKLPETSTVARELVKSEDPIIMFWGVVDRRMDMGFLTRLNNDLREGSIVLIGPEDNPPEELAALSRVVRAPAVPFERLPQLAGSAAVLIMPYADMPVTRAMQPLKLKEYLATGKPVVVSDLPASRRWNAALDLAATPEDFSEIVRDRIVSGLPDSQKGARLLLSEESWNAKAALFLDWVQGRARPLELSESGVLG